MGQVMKRKKSPKEKIIETSSNNIVAIYGDTLFMMNDNRSKIPHYNNNPKYSIAFCHQSVFTRTDLLKKYKFDTNFKICADIDFFTKIYNNGGRFFHTSNIVSRVDGNGLSSRPSWQFFKEQLSIGTRYNIFFGLYFTPIYLAKTIVKQFFPHKLRLFIQSRYNSKISMPQSQQQNKQAINTPLVSIITITYNNIAHIVKTMDSVTKQDYPQIEYIIIDGASNDGTKEKIESEIQSLSYIIKKENTFQEHTGSRFYLEAIHKNNPNFTFKFLSQKDKGIYDAMNKGIDLATGEWCNFMNCGDKFYETDSVEKLFNEYEQTYLNKYEKQCNSS